MKNKSIFKFNGFLSTFQLFFLLAFFSCFFAIYFYPNVDFSPNINAWFEKYWTTGQTNSLDLLLKANGWIIIYESIIIVSIWSFLLFFLMQFLILRNYLIIMECQRTFKSKSLNSNEDQDLPLKNFFENNSKRVLIASWLGFLNIIFWFESYNLFKNNTSFKKYFIKIYIAQKNDVKNFLQFLFFWNYKNYNTITKIFLYLLLISSSVGFIMMFVCYGISFLMFENKLAWNDFSGKENQLYDTFLRLSPIALVYITQFTNISGFIYAFMKVKNPKFVLFKTNTATMYLASAMAIIAVVYWIFLFQIDIAQVNYIEGNNQLLVLTNLLSTGIWHGITPLIFVIYTFLIIFYNNFKSRNFKTIVKPYIGYLALYTVFVYALPLFTKINVYGPFTNLNPNNANEYTDNLLGSIVFPKNGEPLFLLFGAFVFLIFTTVLAFFWGYEKFSYKFIVDIDYLEKLKFKNKIENIKKQT